MSLRMGVEVEQTHPGGRIHEYGAVITPKQASVLHFEVDGKDVFTKKVTIPARPYMRPAAARGAGPAHLAFKAAMAAQIQTLL